MFTCALKNQRPVSFCVYPVILMPSTHYTMGCSKENLNSKGSLRQIRKPVVEKMRRDRINSSIKQLRVLLEKEFQRHQPNSKLEKADILEMAVNYLKQYKIQMNAVDSAQKSSLQDYSQGYSRCLQETFQFLSHTNVQKPTNYKMVQHFNRTIPAATDLPCHGTSTLKSPSSNQPVIIWRPW